MKNVFIIAGIFALAVSFGPLEASAQGRSGGHGGGNGAGMGAATSQGSEIRGLNRADQVAGSHGARGRAVARRHGANNRGFCPPGQRKKGGLGSRFQC